MKSVDIKHVILSRLKEGAHLTLFLDYDGTLVPIAPTPAQAVADPSLLELLGALSQNPQIRAVIVSGRPLEDLRRMLPVAGLTIAGLYGSETWLADGTLKRWQPDNGAREAL